MLYDTRWEETIKVEQPETWRQILLDAADLIKEKGWCQGESCDSAGRLCTIGAISCAASGASLHDVEKATDAVRRIIGVYDIETWNDSRSYTFGKLAVIRTLRKAAKQGI